MEPTQDTQSNKKAAIIIGLIVIVVVVALVGVVLMRNKDSTSDTSTMGNMPANNSTSTDTSNATETNSVMVMNYAFSPAVIKVKVGTKVTWTNMDSVSHTITADTPSADAPNSQLFGNKETYSFTFNKAGTYGYYCQPHPYMKGSVVVTE